MIDLQYVLLLCLLQQEMPNVPSIGVFADLPNLNTISTEQHMGTILVSAYIQLDSDASIILCQL